MKTMNLKKSLFVFALMAFVAFSATAQEKASPARKAEGTAAGSKITINYSSPADDATTFTTEKDIMVEGKKLPAGTYSFFIIPGEYESTLIFNKVAKQWGAYTYDAKEDALRVNVPSSQTSTMEERLVYEVKPDGFEVRWEYGRAAAKIGS
jgi:hypothetical protein